MTKQEYIANNRTWLAEKAAEPGVFLIDKGICYRVIKSGKPGAPAPNRNSVIIAHYTGKTRPYVRHKPARHTACIPLARPDSGMDNSTTENEGRRPLGNLYPGRTSLRTIKSTGHSCRLNIDF